MTRKEEIFKFIQSSNKWLCDDCIADLLPLPRRQMANKYCWELYYENAINRLKDGGSCDRCKKDKIVSKRK